MKKFFNNRSGVAAVEFSLIAPVLIFILIGILDIGMYLNDKMKTEAIARAAVEYLIATRNEDDITTNVIQPYYTGIGDANWSTNFTVDTELVCECEDGGSIDCVTGICTLSDDYKRRFYEVTINKQHETFFSYPGFPDTIMLLGEARMQLD